MRNKNKTENKQLKNLFIILLTILLITFFAVIFVMIKFQLSTQKNSLKCFKTKDFLLPEGNLTGEVSENQPWCYNISIGANYRIHIEPNFANIDHSSVLVSLVPPNEKTRAIETNYTETLDETGNYLLVIQTQKKQELFNINLKIEKINPQIKITQKEDNIARQSEQNNSQTIEYLEKNKLNPDINSLSQIAYNVQNFQAFYPDSQLNEMVNKIVTTAKNRGLPTSKLSVSLVDLTNQNHLGQLAYGSYADITRRYPASIVKLFWMVALFGQYDQGILPKGKIPEKTLTKMIRDSDNEAASKVLDAITNTESGSTLPKPDINYWQQRRESVNQFFAYAGYKNLNINQKTFPIPYLQMNLPSGRDAQIRSEILEIPEKEVNPIRNYLTTHDVARVLFEIRANKSISPYYSDRMDELLTRDLRPEAWKPKPYNAIAGFLGEYLSPDTHFASKMGWTFSNRNDAAIIASADRQTHYILVVFGDDPAYYQDDTFLPEVSKMVYEEMRKKNIQNFQSSPEEK